MGTIYRGPEDGYYDDAEFAIVKGSTVFGNLMDDVSGSNVSREDDHRTAGRGNG